jgi:hypothetical protein
MTRILIHPPLVTQASRGYGRVLLPEPWHWWRTRIRDDLIQRYNHHENLDEYSLLFNFDFDQAEIIDPPVMRVIGQAPDYEDVNFGRAAVRTLVVRGQRRECELVWWEQPGPSWLLLPGNTCELGEYLIADMSRRERAERTGDCLATEWDSRMRYLNWPPIGDTFERTRAMNREEIARIYGIPGALLGVVEVRDWSENLIGVLQEPRYSDPARNNRLPDQRVSKTSKTANAEQPVLDEIDRLVNEQLGQEASGYDHNINQERCPVCGYGWHGLTGTGGLDQTGALLGAMGCPGAFADAEEIKQWHARQKGEADVSKQRRPRRVRRP